MAPLFSATRWFGIDLHRHRWIFPLTSVLAITMCGADYAFSVFVKPIEAEFGWTRAETSLAFSFAMFFFGVSGFVGGYLVDKLGPRIPFAIGAIMMASAQFLAARVNGVVGLILAYGVIGGNGLGFVYASCGTALQSRWFPDTKRRGPAIGFALMGMGIGGLISAPLWTQGVAAIGWRATYEATGIVFATIFLITGTIIRFPAPNLRYTEQDGWQALSESPAPNAKHANVVVEPNEDFTLSEAMRSSKLWLMGLLFFMTVFGGLMVVGQLSAFATESVRYSAASAALLVSLCSVCNGIGRATWGALTSRFGPGNLLTICPLIMATALLLISASNQILLPVGVILCGFAFGGTLVLIPVMSAALFGTRYVGRIYGIIYMLGFGFGGLLGNYSGGYIRTTFGTYTAGFWISAGMSIISATAAGILLPKRGKERQAKPLPRMNEAATDLDVDDAGSAATA